MGFTELRFRRVRHDDKLQRQKEGNKKYGVSNCHKTRDVKKTRFSTLPTHTPPFYLTLPSPASLIAISMRLQPPNTPSNLIINRVCWTKHLIWSWPERRGAHGNILCLGRVHGGYVTHQVFAYERAHVVYLAIFPIYVFCDARVWRRSGHQVPLCNRV